MEIRQARREEWGQIADLISRSPWVLKNQLPKWHNFFTRKEAGRLICCLALDPHSRRLMELRTPAAELDVPYPDVLDPLVDACESRALELNATQVLVTTHFEQFFKKKGYQPYFKEKYALIRRIEGTCLTKYERDLIKLNKNSDIKIRQGKSGDMKAIMELVGQFKNRLVSDPTLMPRPQEFFVAVTERGALAGCVALEYYSRKLCEFRTYVTHPDFQGKGLRLGQRLAAHCMQKAYQRGIFELLAIASGNGSEKGGPSAYKLLTEKFNFSTDQYGHFALIKVLKSSKNA